MIDLGERPGQSWCEIGEKSEVMQPAGDRLVRRSLGMKSMAAWHLGLAAVFALRGFLEMLELGTVSSSVLPVVQPQAANA